MIVVADTTPIISLLKIHHLAILRDLYGTVHIPPAVYAELTNAVDFPDEAEAIVLAAENETKALLIDELRGRAVATQMDLPVTGVIGVLAAAYQKHYLTADEVRQSVTDMRRANRFISESLYTFLLSQLG